MSPQEDHPRPPASGPASKGIAYGGDYNPEQWPVSVRLEDLELMKEAGVTFLSVGHLLLGAAGTVRRRV